MSRRRTALGEGTVGQRPHPTPLSTPGLAAAKDMRASVIVHLKPGISDPEGKNTQKALHLLGFDAVRDVHTTRIWEIDLGDVAEDEARTQVDRMCRRLLTNPVIHDYTVELKA